MIVGSPLHLYKSEVFKTNKFIYFDFLFIIVEIPTIG